MLGILSPGLRKYSLRGLDGLSGFWAVVPGTTQQVQFSNSPPTGATRMYDVTGALYTVTPLKSGYSAVLYSAPPQPPPLAVPPPPPLPAITPVQNEDALFTVAQGTPYPALPVKWMTYPGNEAVGATFGGFFVDGQGVVYKVVNEQRDASGKNLFTLEPTHEVFPAGESVESGWQGPIYAYANGDGSSYISPQSPIVLSVETVNSIDAYEYAPLHSDDAKHSYFFLKNLSTGKIYNLGFDFTTLNQGPGLTGSIIQSLVQSMEIAGPLAIAAAIVAPAIAGASAAAQTTGEAGAASGSLDLVTPGTLESTVITDVAGAPTEALAATSVSDIGVSTGTDVLSGAGTLAAAGQPGLAQTVAKSAAQTAEKTLTSTGAALASEAVNLEASKLLKSGKAAPSGAPSLVIAAPAQKPSSASPVLLALLGAAGIFALGKA